MPYKTLLRDVSVLKPVGEVRSADGSYVALEHVSVTYEEAGTVIEDRDVSPVVQKQVEDGDPWVLGLLEKVEDAKEDEADEAPAPRRRAKKAAPAAEAETEEE